MNLKVKEARHERLHSVLTPLHDILEHVKIHIEIRSMVAKTEDFTLEEHKGVLENDRNAVSLWWKLHDCLHL
jgi:hypothetical protein